MTKCCQHTEVAGSCQQLTIKQLYMVNKFGLT